MREIFDYAKGSTQIEPSTKQEASLVLLPRSGSSKTVVSTTFKQIIDFERTKGRVVYLKSHPLDSPLDYRTHFNPELVVLPSFLPSEVIPAAIPKITSIYGPPNTSLLAAKFFFPDLNVYLIEEKTTEFSMKLRQIGVKSITAARARNS